jgi:hypothetical protein
MEHDAFIGPASAVPGTATTAGTDGSGKARR